MCFDDGVTQNYILYNTNNIKTGATEANVIYSGANGQNVISGAAPQWVKLPAAATAEFSLQFGSNVTLNPNANNPINPNKKTCRKMFLAKIVEYLTFWNKWGK